MLRSTSPAVLVVTFSLLAVACGETAFEAPASRTVSQAVGEPIGEYPSYSERLILYMTNRSRAEPATFNPGEPYPASPPLKWNLELSKAARFHAQHIIDDGCWCEDHSSCCELTGTGDNVSCGGPVIGCGATSAGARVNLWTPLYSGENMAMGQASAAQAIKDWTFSSGHWANINEPSHTLLGPGRYDAGWVQDFGSARGLIPVAEDGIHMLDGAAVRFGISYYQPGTGGPRTALVIVDGECHELSVAYGEPDHGAFEASLSSGAGCHRYYFHFTDGEGNDHTYPSSGSFGYGNAEDCPFFLDTRPADTCSPSGQTCETGDTRHCYTGPFGTKDVGICEAGVERCIAGQWTGECRLEVHPEPAEVCGNELDDNCDGDVDEGCAEPDMGQQDAGSDDAGADVSVVVAPPDKKTDDGCSTAGSRPPLGPLLLIGLLLGIVRRLPRA